MLDKIHKILRDRQCRGNINCLVAGICTTMFFLCLTIITLFGLDHSIEFNKRFNDVLYKIIMSEDRIDKLENFQKMMIFYNKI